MDTLEMLDALSREARREEELYEKERDCNSDELCLSGGKHQLDTGNGSGDAGGGSRRSTGSFA